MKVLTTERIREIAQNVCGPTSPGYAVNFAESAARIAQDELLVLNADKAVEEIKVNVKEEIIVKPTFGNQK